MSAAVNIYPDLFALAAERAEAHAAEKAAKERIAEIDAVLRPALEAAAPEGIPFDGDGEWGLKAPTPAHAVFPALTLAGELAGRGYAEGIVAKVYGDAEVRPMAAVLDTLALTDAALRRWIERNRTMKGARAGAIYARKRAERG